MAKIVHMTSVATTFHVRIFARQCASLAASGNEVVLLCTHDRDETVQGVTIKTVGKPRGRFSRMTRTVSKLFASALREKADLYVVHDPELTPVAWLLQRLGKPVVLDMHENTPKQILAKAWIPGYLRRAFSLSLAVLQRALLPRIPVVFAESSYAKHYPYVEQTATVLNMPHPGNTSTKFEHPTVGYIGGVSTLRGNSTTLRALALLEERGVAVNYECIGPVALGHREELAAAQERLTRSQVNAPGYMRSDEGWQRIARCHIGIAVLSNTPNYYESFPGKMFEYMSFGLPVIVSDFPLYRGVVDRVGCGFCVDPEDPHALADAIEQMLANREEAAEMGRRGKRAVEEQYNWPREYQRLVAFYNGVLQAHEKPNCATKTTVSLVA